MRPHHPAAAVRFLVLALSCSAGATSIGPVLAVHVEPASDSGDIRRQRMTDDLAAWAKSFTAPEQQIYFEIPEGTGLTYDRRVGGAWTDIQVGTITPALNEVIFGYGKTTTRITSGTGILSAARIICGSGAHVKTTTNIYADGTETPQWVRFVYQPTAAEIGTRVTCRLQAKATSGYTMTVAGDAAHTKTWLRLRRELVGWAWGTMLDANNARDNGGDPVTIIGPGLQSATRSSGTDQTCTDDSQCTAVQGTPCYNDACNDLPCDCVRGKCQRFAYGAENPDVGSTEYIMKGRRFTAHAFATALDVYADPELTCHTNNSDKFCGVEVTLMVQRMKSSTSDAVCHVARFTQKNTITNAQHHKKLWLSALNVPINIRCTDGTMPSGRTFVVKTHVALTTANDNSDYVVVEVGKHEDPRLVYDRGYSITNVLQRFPVAGQ